MLDIVAWLVVGAVIGWIASMIMGTPQRGMLLNVVIAVAGAVLAGLVLIPMLGMGNITQDGISLPSLLVALLGAVTLLSLTSLARGASAR